MVYARMEIFRFTTPLFGMSQNTVEKYHPQKKTGSDNEQTRSEANIL